MLRLRLTEGFSFRQCASDTGTDIRCARSSELETLQRGGYIIINGGQLPPERKKAWIFAMR